MYDRDRDPSKAHHRSKFAPDQSPKPKRKPKPRPKHLHGGKASPTKPTARAPGVAPAPKEAKVGVRDPWAPAAPAPAEKVERREEHEERSEVEEHESTDEMVGDTLGHVDDTHLGLDALLNGSTSGKGVVGLAEKLGEEQAELVAGELGAGKTALGAAGAAIAAPVSIVGGLMEFINGRNEYDQNLEGGTRAMLSGGASVLSGAATVGALTGAPLLAAASPGLAAFGAGVKIGGYGSDQARQSGWLHDNDGEATTPSSWSADRGDDAEQWVTKHLGSERLGGFAGGVTALGVGATVGGATALAGAVNGATLKAEDFGSRLGTFAARDHRAGGYAGPQSAGGLDAVDGIGYRDPGTGQVSIVKRGTVQAFEAGQQMATYDDQLSDAVDRAKVLHPEQWGEAQNTVSMTNQVVAQLRAIQAKKNAQ